MNDVRDTGIVHPGRFRSCCLFAALWVSAGPVSGSDAADHPRAHDGTPLLSSVVRALHGEPLNSGVSGFGPGHSRGMGSEWVQRDKIRPSDGVDGVMDHFGWDVALDGDTIVTIACEAAGGSSAYVHTRSNEIWTEQVKLTPMPDEFPCHSFYQGAVALDGDTLVLGMSLHPDTLLGSAFVYQRIGGHWTQQAALVPSDSTEVSLYGYSVAMDGDTVLVGAPALSTTSVFTRSGETWSEQAGLTGTEPPSETAFGWSVAVQGDTAVVSELGNPDIDIPAAVHVFTREAGSWSLQATLAPSDGGSDVEFGGAVALDGETIAVGAVGRTLDGQAAVYVFVHDGEEWAEQAKLVQPPEAPSGNQGRALALQGDTLIVGDQQARAAYLHVRENGHWSHASTLVAADDQSGARFGASVALDGDTAVVSIFPVGFLGDGSNGWAYAFDTRDPAPATRFSPTFIDLGPVPVGQVSTPRQVVVENNGGAELIFSELISGGAHADDFLLAADTCSGKAIAPGASCSLEIEFAPSALDWRTAWLDVVSNAPTSADRLTFQGTGLPGPPVIRLDPDQMALTMVAGTTVDETLTITNPGTFDLEWELLTQGEPGDAPGTVSAVTHSASMAIVAGNTPRCTAGDGGATLVNKFLRTFTMPDLGIAGAFDVTEVTFGVERLTTTTDITINLYTLDGEFVFENLTLIGSAVHTLDAQTAKLVSVPVTAAVAAGATLVVELDVPSLLADSAFFQAGSNSEGETAPSYLAAPGAEGCDIDQPVSMASLGFPATHLVMVVTGSLDCTLPDWLTVTPPSGVVAGGASNALTATVDSSQLAVGEYDGQFCLTSNDPSRPTLQVPVTLNVIEPVTDAIFHDRLESGT